MFDDILRKERLYDWGIAFEEGIRNTGFRYVRDELNKDGMQKLCDSAQQNRVAYFKDDSGYCCALYYFRSDDCYLLLCSEREFTMERGYVHDWQVAYGSDLAYTGFAHLRDDLSEAEARVFFETAAREGQAHFEDDRDNNFTLVYNSGEREFVLMQRARD